MTDLDVRALRAQLGMTQQQFATYLCMSLASINKWERMKGKPSGTYNTVLWLVSDAVKVSGGPAVATALQEAAMDRRKLLESLMRLGWKPIDRYAAP